MKAIRLKEKQHCEKQQQHATRCSRPLSQQDFTKKILAMEDEKGGGSAVARPYDPPAAVLSQWLQTAYHVPSEKQAPKAFHMRLRKTKSEDLKKHSETPLEEREDETSVKQPEITPICFTGVQTFDTSFEARKPEELDDARDREQILKVSSMELSDSSPVFQKSIKHLMDESNTSCNKRLKLENTPGLEEERYMSCCSTDRESDTDAVDVVDLPTFDDDETCRFEQEGESKWDHGEEEEKACSDRGLNASNRQHRFSRVYAVNFFNGKANVPKKYKPLHGSPSASIKKDPYLMCEPIQSTKRIRVSFKDDLNKYEKVIYGTAFSLSSKVGCSARYCFLKDGMKLLGIDICEGSHVSPYQFDLESFKGQYLEASTKYWSQTKDKDGLYSDGADIGMFRSRRAFKSFLLPCSPSFLSVSQCKNVGIPSYPGVDGMLHKAKQELSKSSTSDTWKAYKPAMTKDISDEFQKVSASQQMKGKSKRQIMTAVLKDIKQVLYADLKETFGVFSSGDMLCAVGSIIGWNNVSIGSTCSTLRGSSGAPLCAFGLPGYFFGIHSGGVCGFDMNGATSSDNEEFVRMYMIHVLPTLPSVNSCYWINIDTRGFIHWLKIHIDEIPRNSPWLVKVSETKKDVVIV